MTVSLPLALSDGELLRAYDPSDSVWMLDLYSRPEVVRFLFDEPWTPDVAREKAAERMARTALDGPTGALSVVVVAGGAPVGDVSLWYTNRERGIAEIGWSIRPEAGGRGLATRAVSAVLDTAFAHHDLHRVVAQMDARNTASARLAARVGMQQEAHLRQDWWSKGEWTDTLVFAMLASGRPPRGV